jgi:hypothetical protein
VFVGDLCDRGPDSPAVVTLVERLVRSGRAFAVLGNHELNLLRGDRKKGNDWFWGEGAHHDQDFQPFVTVDPHQRESFLAFFESLPLTLSRSDLRIVHAAWHQPSIATLSLPANVGAINTLFTRFDDAADAALSAGGWQERAAAEKAAYRHHLNDATAQVPMLEAVGHCEEWRQMQNPIRVLTSGFERQAKEQFFTSGQWRFAARVPWWNEYDEDVAVVVGHYWRKFFPMDQARTSHGDTDLFEDVPPTAWVGARRNVFCVDFSVGARFEERRSNAKIGTFTRLAALRWPERTLMVETGEIFDTSRYCAGPG